MCCRPRRRPASSPTRRPAPKVLPHRALLTECVNRRSVIAEDRAQHVVRVLTWRGDGTEAAWSLRHLDRDAGHVHLAGDGIVHLDEHLTFPEVWILRDLGNR